MQTLTLITGLPEVIIAVAKAVAFGPHRRPGRVLPRADGRWRRQGVGIAVNETLVLCVVALFAVNVIFTTIGVRFGTGH